MMVEVVMTMKVIIIIIIIIIIIMKGNMYVNRRCSFRRQKCE